MRNDNGVMQRRILVVWIKEMVEFLELVAKDAWRIGILNALFSPRHREPTHRRASGWPALDTAGRPPARTAGPGPDGGQMTGSQRGCETGTAEETGSNALAHSEAPGYCRAASNWGTCVGVQDASMGRGAAYGEQQDAWGCRGDAKGEEGFQAED